MHSRRSGKRLLVRGLNEPRRLECAVPGGRVVQGSPRLLLEGGSAMESLRYRLIRFYCFSFSDVVFDKYIFSHLTMACKVNVREFLKRFISLTKAVSLLYYPFGFRVRQFQETRRLLHLKP